MNEALIKETLSTLLSFFDFTVDSITMRQEGDITRVDIASPEASRLIGWHGETLNSVQHLLKSIIRAKEDLEKSPFIVLDVDGYRKMQEDKVCRIADQKADFVRRTGSRVALSPMSPYFRRIVHLYIANNPSMNDLVTESVGEGDYRQIVMRMKNPNSRGADAAPSEELSPVISNDDGLENLDI